MPYDLERLEPFAVEFRYDSGDAFSDDDRAAIRETVAILREHILNRIFEVERKSLP